MSSASGGTLPSRGEPARSGRAYSPDVERRLPAGWSPHPPAQTRTVGDEFVAVSRAHGPARAAAWLTEDGIGEISWDRLRDRAECVARALMSRSSPGDRVVLVAVNSVDWLAAAYGCALAGLPFVPVSARSTSAELAHVLRRSNAKGVLLGPGSDPAVVAAADGGAALWQSTIAGLESAGERIADGRSYPETHPDAEFLVQLTSGTTGRPKLAVLSHRAALGCARVYVAGVTPRTGDSWFNPLPLHHVGGSVSGALAALSTRGSYTVLERFDPAAALRVLREISPTVVGMVPTMVIDLLASPTVARTDFDSVRVVVGGATAVDPALIDRVEAELGVRFLVGYGQSESPCMAMSASTDPTEVRIATLGRPLTGRDYCIASAEGLAATGEIGELCVRGPLMMSGYLDDDGELHSPLDEAGWLRTGDLCSLDAEGVLRFHARTREVIIRGGSNIYPAEVEAVVSSHAEVAAVAVFGEPDDRLGQVVAAAVVGVDGSVDVDDVEAHCRRILSASKVPTRWHVVHELPRTSTGKVRKERLRDQLAVRPAATGPGTVGTRLP